MIKNNLYTDSINKGQKGQALLFVVVAMTIALTIGINASVRTITSLSRTSRTDTASKALAAAEGGLERFLVQNTQTLRAVVEGNSCPAGTYPDTFNSDFVCRVEFNSDDGLNTQAFVQVEFYQPDSYVFEIEPGEVNEVNLRSLDGNFYDGGGEIEICWRTPGASGKPNADIFYISYDQNGIQASGGLAGNPSPDNLGYITEGFMTTTSSTHDGFENCQQNIDLGSDITYGLRIRALGLPATVGIFSSDPSYTIPLQGFRITSIGTLENYADITSGVAATRRIIVIKTLPYLPAAFDYAVYSRGAADFYGP